MESKVFHNIWISFLILTIRLQVNFNLFVARIALVRKLTNEEQNQLLMHAYKQMINNL